MENRGDYETEQELMDPATIQDLKQAYYVSTVINKTEQQALTALVALTPPPPHTRRYTMEELGYSLARLFRGT